MQSQSDKVKFTVAALSKTRRSGPPREVEYSQFEDNPKLCPVKFLLTYVEKTKDKRAEKEYKLFLALKKPHVCEYRYHFQVVKGNVTNGRNKQFHCPLH